MSIVLHEGQSEVYRSLFLDKTCRFAVDICSRGWGKSYFGATAASTAVFELMGLASNIPNKNVYIIAPTYDQVVDIYYPLLAHELGLEQFAVKSSKADGRFWFPKNVELRLISFEAIERMRGKGAYFVVCDEVRDWTKGMGFKDAWESVILPCINTRWSRKRARQLFAPSPGRALIISTPKGYDYLYDMYNRHEIDPDWRSWHFDYHSSPYLDPEEIERIKDQIDPIKFAREYLASFKGSGNNVFYCFDRKTHVRKDIPDIQPWEDVHVGIDFNVGIQASSAFVVRGSQVHYFDEFSGHPDTENLAISIRGRYANGQRKIYAYPDPSGRARKTSAPVGVTDFTILQKYGIVTRAHTKAPPIVDSVNAVNKKLMTASGVVDMYFSPKCVGTIASMERTSWVDNNPDTATINKKEGVEHFSDGVRYAQEFLFPIRVGNKAVAKGFGF